MINDKDSPDTTGVSSYWRDVNFFKTVFKLLKTEVLPSIH